eukprot:1088885-Prymnesium_polylepis.2
MPPERRASVCGAVPCGDPPSSPVPTCVCVLRADGTWHADVCHAPNLGGGAESAGIHPCPRQRPLKGGY